MAEIDEARGEKDGEGTIDLRHYWNILKKRRWVIIATTVIVTVMAMVITMRKPKIYKATATVIVDPYAPNYFGQQGTEIVQLGTGNFWNTDQYFNTQLHILESTALARMVVVENDLIKDRRLLPRPPKDASEEQLIDLATTVLKSRIVTTIAKDSRVFEIAVVHTDPKLSADLANMVARAFIKQNVSYKQTATVAGRGAVAQQLQRARDELDKAETALVQYKESNALLSFSLEDQQNQTFQSLQTFRADRDRAQTELDAATSKRAAIARLLKSGTADIPSDLASDSAVISTLAVAVQEEQSKLDELTAHYGDKWPAVQQQAARVKTAKDALTGKLTSILHGLDENIRAIQDRLAKADARVKELTEEGLKLGDKARKYKELNRAQKIAEEQYIALMSRHDQSALQEADQANNIHELDAAVTPGAPVSPNMRLSLAIGLALGLMLALGLAFLIEFLDRSVKSQEDVEQVVGLPFLGMVPSLEGTGDGKGTPELYIARQPASTIAECCRVVRTNILFSSPDKPLHTLLVTSSNPVEGKTTSVVNLGIVMAQSGHRTLIVDTDMRRPRLHKALGCGNENGLSRVIVGESEVDAAIKSTEVPNLFIMPCGPIPPNPAELLQTERFAALAEQLKEKFDRVIFDSPPVLAVTDAAVLSRVVDGAVLVVRAGRTTRDAVIRSKRAVQAVNKRIIGVVLNDVNLKNPHYASYYHYYQYKPHDQVAEASKSA